MPDERSKDITYALLFLIIVSLANFIISIVSINMLRTEFNHMCKVEHIPIVKTVYVQQPPNEVSEPVIAETLIQEEPRSMEQTIDGFVDDICKLYPNVKPELVKSVIWHESTYDPNVKTGVCLGLMQISTRWHAARMERLGVTDIYDPYGNILVGVDYLSELISKNNDIGLALMLYNMNHKDAYNLHSEGKLSYYATSVLKRANM